ncbi:cache domain-containing sensor histidine kinase [Paenibacillus rigui]|uniref:HAMP domain-containing protein n=1 Tax=Paenibacillus rigui TaxID=554312 RepID=A0A229UTZ1_9BACL|nr:sensor histidine kinase [Paenibacillus rigui]OXM86731.1 hypothetical protein CF651_07715 [Paenibacillus rigui]
MRNPFKTFSFQTTFFVSFIIISALLILLLGITSYYITNQEVVEQTISSRKLLLNEINKQLDSAMQTVEYDSLVLASNPKLINYLQYNDDSFEHIQQKSDIIDLLSRLSYVKEGVHSVQLYTKSSSIDGHIGANGVFDYSIIKQSPWYNEIKDADYCWAGTHAIEVGSYPAEERNVVSFARKVLAPSGEEVGILVINLNLSFMQKVVSGSSQNVSRVILDTRHRLIAEFNDGSKSDSFASMKENLSEVLDKSASETYAIAQLEEKKLIIWNQQDRTMWVTMDIIPWDDIEKGSRRIEMVMLVAVIFCILLAIIMAYLLSKQFIFPIRNLVHAMNMMKGGKLDIQIINDYHNEFGHMNENFNQMTARINHLLIEVNEQHKRKREAEMQVLQEQINPHFLYNTLDTMNWHAIESGSREISHMLSLLGKMLRIGLSSGATFITIQRELEHLHYYMELQKIRYKQRVEFHISIPESMKIFYTPKLIIQPFVENALIHGLHSCERGLIHISGWEDEQSLYFRIEDNGEGMDTDMTVLTRDHNGIRNVRERIQLNFGQRYGVEVYSERGQGTAIMLSLPKIRTVPPHYTEGNAK